MTCKVDLHVHSKHSNDPSEWYLRRLGAPESYTEPLAIYRSARARGMDFVTISDHDSIEGALEIAHLPGVFLSNEVTASFPEDGCEIHCLVFGLSEAEHGEIQRLRGNVYELRDYLRSARIAHSVAHPLFRVNGRLTLAHFEKLLVLFDTFEALNGMHDRRANEVTRRILSSLTRKAVEDAAERHGLEPFGPTPWVKRLTGGSDDHGGHYVAATYTRTPAAASLADLLDHLREGRCEAGGETGSSARLARSLYGLSYEYYRRVFPAILGNRDDPFVAMLRELAEGPSPAPVPPRRYARRAFAWLGEKVGFRLESPKVASPPLADRFTTLRVGRLSRDAYSKMLSAFFRQARHGRMAGALGELSRLAPLAISVFPYLVSMRSLHKDGDLLDAASLRFLGGPGEDGRPKRRAWFGVSDPAPEEMPGKLGLLRRIGEEREIAVVTVGRSAPAGRPGSPLVSVGPLSEIPLPAELGGGTLAVPNLLEALDLCERERYAEIGVVGAGPHALAGLLAGRLLGLPTLGLFASDLPARLRAATGSETLESLAWSYLRWFFGSLDLTYVASMRERQALVARGFDPRRLRLIPPAGQAAREVARGGGAILLESTA